MRRKALRFYALPLFQWPPPFLRGAIPAFIHISDGKMHEVNVLDFLPVEAGVFYVMDRGYPDFARL